MQSPLALTLGEPSGIGPELALKIWLNRKRENLPSFLLYADIDFMRDHAQMLGWDVPVVASSAATAQDDFQTALPVSPLKNTVKWGRDPALNAAAVIESIDSAVDSVLSGQTRAVVTNPIAKSYLMQQGFAFAGHTEYLANRAQFHGYACGLPVMMLWCDELAVIPVTVHIPLADVQQTLSQDLIVATARIAAESLKQWFGIDKPRLAITGLNPHAGESGLLGLDEERVIIPAIKALQAEGIDAKGPYPADTLFHAAARKNYDVALAMYHDQALIPIKTIAFDRGVNATLGLPFVRTSPDHGTAFDKAGKGCADPSSLLAAIHLADRLTTKALS